MLKAVRFDENEHKQLLDFIEFYVDEKGRRNDSEAIRYLMQKGLEAVRNPQFTEVNTSTTESTVDINTLKKEVLNEIASLLPKETAQPNLEQLKQELYNQVLSEINASNLNSINAILDKLSNFQPMVVQQPVQQTISQPVESTPKPAPTPVKKVEIPADADGLLGNILGNANR